MTGSRSSTSAVFLLALAACGGDTAARPATATATATAAGAPYSKASIDAFHEMLAPLWHSPESPERTEKTCAAVPAMETRAQEIGDARLVETLHELQADCTGGRKEFQSRFAAVHTAFHGAMEKAGVGHDEKEHHR